MDKEIQELYKQKTECINNLLKTDYKALKYAEGMSSETEYAPIKLQRQAWRDEINSIELEIEALKNS
jgi:hypothetical protein